MQQSKSTIFYYSGKGPPFIEEIIEQKPDSFNSVGVLFSFPFYKRKLTYKRMNKILGIPDGE